MPTSITQLGRERTLATLARRVYRIDANDAEALARATAALAKANPRLTTSAGFRSGASVVVPGVAGLERAEAVLATRADGTGLQDETTLRLQALASRLEDGYAQAARDREEARALLGNNRFLAQARRSLPESVAILNQTARRLDQEEEQDKAASAQFARAIAEAMGQVKLLDELGRKGGQE